MPSSAYSAVHSHLRRTSTKVIGSLTQALEPATPHHQVARANDFGASGRVTVCYEHLLEEPSAKALEQLAQRAQHVVDRRADGDADARNSDEPHAVHEREHAFDAADDANVILQILEMLRDLAELVGRDAAAHDGGGAGEHFGGGLGLRSEVNNSE